MCEVISLISADKKSVFDTDLDESKFEKQVNRYIELQKEISRLKELPTAEFDEELGKPYLLHPNGERTYYD